MTTGISVLSAALQTKIANIDVTDGLSAAEVKEAGLTNSEIAEIKAAGFSVDAGADINPDVSLDELDTLIDVSDSTDITALNTKKTEIETAIAKLKEEVTALTTEKTTQENELAKINETYLKEAQELEDKNAEFDKKQNQLADLNEQIAATQKAETKRFEGKMSDITAAALKEYDPQKDGDDFEAYLNSCLATAGISTYSALDSLNSEAVALANETNALLSDIKSQTKVVQSLMSSINAQKALITSLSNQIDVKNANITTQESNLKLVQDAINKLSPGAGLTGKEVLAAVSPAELSFAKGLNIDLTEKYDNGNPRYVFAKGADDQYHIYEMDKDGVNGTSLARQFGTTGSGLRGSDLVPSGSGYIRNSSDAAPGGGRAVYSFSCINEDWSDGTASSVQKCYTTCSPLSFDVDGNGVNTSSEKVKFDIDGDGILDTVNNSAEWVLAFDKDKDGIAGEDGSELFGDNTDLDGDGVKDGYGNGFEALKALAQKEGLIGPEGGVLGADGLKLLEEKYGLVMTRGYGGEAKSLSELGITEINLAATNATKTIENFDGQHNNLMTQEGATFVVNGQKRDYADIWNAKLDDVNPEIEVPKSNFDIDSIDLSFGDKAIKTAEGLESVVAKPEEVDFFGIREEAKALTKKAQANIIYEKPEEEKPQQEEEDDDFLNFQKKKLI